MKELFKKNYKVVIGVLIGAIVSGIGTYAAVSIASSSVSYDNSSSGATATDVKGAIDELYALANSKACPSGYTKSGGEYTYTCSKPAPAPVTFADDSWDVIIANIQSGNTSAYTVGSTKTVDLGTLGTHTLRVANTSTPAECSTAGFSQTACGFVLEFADIITTHQMNPYDSSKCSTNGYCNKGGWEYSEMRTYVNTDIYNALPTLLKNAIINTTVVSGHGYNNDTTNFTTTDKLYLLSTHEVWEDDDGNTSSGIDKSDTAYNNTRQLDYYKNNNVTTSSYSGAIKQNNGSNIVWWLRSAYSTNGTYFWRVYDYGYCSNYYSNYPSGVAPAFRIG